MNEEYQDVLNISKMNQSSIAHNSTYNDYPQEAQIPKGHSIMPAPFRSSSKGPQEALGQSA
jgi:hypothetical protein